jgi:hypothetical protein
VVLVQVLLPSAEETSKLLPHVFCLMLLEPVRLSGSLQKGGELYLALGYQLHDIVAEKNFRMH